jgi:hypothetical protein
MLHWHKHQELTSNLTEITVTLNIDYRIRLTMIYIGSEFRSQLSGQRVANIVWLTKK